MTISQHTRKRSDDAPVLAVKGLRKEFGGVVALNHVDLEIMSGEIVSIVGPNGAGKTTLFNCIMGRHDLTGGAVTLNGDNITGLPTQSIVHRGLSCTFQIPRVFPNLTVAENMEIYQSHRSESILKTIFKRTDESTNDRIDDLLSFVDIRDMKTVAAGSLSTGQQKLLNLGAVLLREPEVVLLDEPTAGVNPKLVQKIKKMIQTLGQDGQTFVIIEHDMDVVREITDFVYVLANGTNLVSGSPEVVLNNDEVLEVYFGE